VLEKKPKHETMGSRKCGCMFMVTGYLSKQTNEWSLNILTRHLFAQMPCIDLRENRDDYA